MLLIAIYLCFTAAPFTNPTSDDAYANEIRAWQAAREKKLTAENGWLSLAGRYPLKEGWNTIGTGASNDVVFPKELKGTGPEQIGAVIVDIAAKRVYLKLAGGVSMTSAGKPFFGERDFTIADDKKDWVTLDRLSFHIIDREGRYFLRLADNESPVRKNFPGCVWYAPDEAFKVEAKFTPALAGKTLAILNVLGEDSSQPLAGQVEFKLKGKTHKLDAIQEGEGLFILFKDETSGDSTYGSGRFIDVEKTPKAGEFFTLDFNKAYNPPCAVSQFTTCPIPPKQNHLKIKIEAGERTRK
jgi:uncharacterized protein